MFKAKMIHTLKEAFSRCAHRNTAGKPPGFVRPSKYYRHLPRKRSSAAVLVFKDGQLLTLETTYQNTLTVPGGMVEKNESPLAAAVRECREEIGVDISIKGLLCVDYGHGELPKGDTVAFVFLGDVNGQQIRPDGAEIKGFKYRPLDEVFAGMDDISRLRIAAALKGLKENRVVYAEDGLEPVVLAPAALKPASPPPRPA